MPHHLSPLLTLSITVIVVACGEDSSPTFPESAGGPPAEAVTTAVTRVVNSLADPGDGVCDARQCTLREAIRAAGTTDITFAAGLGGAVTLAEPAAGGGTLPLGQAVTITGPSGRITIRRRSADPAFRIMRVDAGAVVSLTNLEIRNGKTDLPGGGIINRGRLALRNCVVAGNAATGGAGGIDNRGPLTLVNSTVADNAGGGIYTQDERAELNNVVITGNAGQGIFNRSGFLQMTGGRVSDNAGRGIWQQAGGSRLERVRITGNTGGGLLLFQGTSTVTGSTISGNSAVVGGGVYNVRGARITITKSTISGNNATGPGGGIYNEDDPFGRVGAGVRLVNSTVSGNTAETGGGIETEFRGSSSLLLTNTTVTANSARTLGGGIRQFGGGDPGEFAAFLQNSIVAENTAPTGPDLSGSFDATSNLIGDASGSDVTNTRGNQVGRVPPHPGLIDPRLGPLASNGGLTATHALLAGSPALDTASAAFCPGKDQRGVTRPQGTGCDVGSFEREVP